MRCSGPIAWIQPPLKPRSTRLISSKARPPFSVVHRSPLCGSTVTVDVKMHNGRIADFGQDVKACALGQAAASVVGGAIIGRTPEQISEARDALKAMLKTDGPTPPAPFDGLEVLRPAAAYKNRHASIMLTLDAAFEAAQQAQQTATG